MVCYVQHFWSLFLSWWIRHTSSIHSRESIITSWSVSMPRFLFCSSLAISSINWAYSMTDSTPPCLMLSLISIGSVRPYLVWILAVRFEFSFLASLRFFPGFHSCGGRIEWHPAMTCHMLSGRPGRLHMLFYPSFWFRGLFVSVL